MDKPTNTVGFANCFGNLQFTGHFGTIRLSADETYDFYYQYSSWGGAKSPLLGQNFFVPLLESTLIDHDYFLEVTTLGGATNFLYRLPAEPTTYLSYDGKSQAKRLSLDRFIRTSRDGFQLEYEGGRLMKFKTPKDTLVRLTYGKNGCESVRGSGGSLVVGVTRISETHVRISTHSGHYNIQLQVYQAGPNPTMAELGRGPGPTPRTVKTVVWPDGAHTEFAYDPKDEQFMKMRMSYAGSGVDFTWSKHDESIRSAGAVDYVVDGLSREWDPAQEVIRAGSYSIQRLYPDGSWKRFSQNEDTGLVEEESSESLPVRTYWIKNRGPTYNYVKKRERLKEDSDEFETFYRAFYDTSGNLLRQISEGRLIHHLRPDSENPSFELGEDEDFYHYDAEGRVDHSRIEGRETHRRFLNNGVRREVTHYPWGETTLHYYSAVGKALPLPAKDNFPEAGSE